MASITEDLLNELKSTKDIQAFLDKHEKEFLNETPVSILNHMAETKKLTTAKIATASGAGEYVYKVFNNTRKPSRNILIAIALGMGISIEEIQLLLRISKLAVLDSRDKRDSVIIYAFSNNLSVFELDDLLAQNGFLTIN